MKVKELVAMLLEEDQESEIAILDGFNGGGQPRKINFGPVVHDPKDPEIDWPHEMNDYSDLDTPDGEKIVKLGYGCY